MLAGHRSAALHGRCRPRAGHPGGGLDHPVRPPGPNRRVHPQSGSNRQRAEWEGQVTGGVRLSNRPVLALLSLRVCVLPFGALPLLPALTTSLLGSEIERATQKHVLVCDVFHHAFAVSVRIAEIRGASAAYVCMGCVWEIIASLSLCSLTPFPVAEVSRTDSGEVMRAGSMRACHALIRFF